MQKKFRLRKTSDFGKTFKEGKRLSSPHFVLYIRENDLPHSRLGVAVSKSYLKLATRRNKIKRIAKNLFEQEIMTGIKGRDFVLASKKKKANDKFNEVVRELKNFLYEVKTRSND